MNTASLFLFIPFISFSSFATETQCDVELKNGLKIQAEKIDIFSTTENLYTIKDSHSLIINGKNIALTKEQEILLQDFARSLRLFVPKTIDLIHQSSDASEESINTYLNTLLGSHSPVKKKLSTALAQGKKQIKNVFNNYNGIALIEANAFEKIEKSFEIELKKAFEESFFESIGSLIASAIGILINERNHIKAKLEQHEIAMEEQANALKKLAHCTCEQIKKLNSLESRVLEKIKQLEKRELIINTNEK